MTKPSLQQQIGRNLAQARKARNITQKQLADELKKYQPDYSDYETGNIELNYDQIVFLCERLDMSPNELFDVESLRGKFN